MKRRMWVLALLSVGFFMVSNTVVWAAAAAAKIGHFELQQVLDKSKIGQEAKESFKDEKAKIKGDIDEKAKTYKTAKEEFDKKKSVMDESTRIKKTKEIDQLQQEGERFIMEANTKLNKLSNELMAPIVDKVLDIVRKKGRDDKYDYIIEVGKGGLVFANDKNDLTKSIIEELDRSPSKP